MARYKEFWYNSWRSMMSRCSNPKAENYKYYGAIGIAVCDAWRNADIFGEWAKIAVGFRVLHLKGLIIQKDILQKIADGRQRKSKHITGNLLILSLITEKLII